MNMGIIIMIAVACLWAIGIFMGIIGGLSKPFAHSPAAMDSSDIKSQEQKSIEETEAKRKQMMDDIKQKMQDANQRF